MSDYQKRGEENKNTKKKKLLNNPNFINHKMIFLKMSLFYYLVGGEAPVLW